MQIYDALWHAYGPQGWWPGETPIEVIVGAILTQNTAWRNVERAIAALEQADLMNWEALGHVPLARLEEVIRPAGTFRIKALRLKAFVDVLLGDHDGSLERLFAGPLDDARARLLAIHGIGPETADAILLYAAGRPTFVVDAYTRRILRRHGLADASAGYDAVRRLFMDHLPHDTRMFNEYHALLVHVAKRHCRAAARCAGCPLESMPHDETA